jgi:hypothetical protein
MLNLLKKWGTLHKGVSSPPSQTKSWLIKILPDLCALQRPWRGWWLQEFRSRKQLPPCAKPSFPKQPSPGSLILIPYPSRNTKNERKWVAARTLSLPQATWKKWSYNVFHWLYVIYVELHLLWVKGVAYCLSHVDLLHVHPFGMLIHQFSYNQKIVMVLLYIILTSWAKLVVSSHLCKQIEVDPEKSLL